MKKKEKEHLPPQATPEKLSETPQWATFDTFDDDPLDANGSGGCSGGECGSGGSGGCGCGGPPLV